MQKVLLIGTVIAIALGIWFFLVVQELSNTGDPARIAEINIAITEYAATIEPTQSPKIRTRYFTKAYHYISEFALADSASGQIIEYSCSWPDNESKVDLTEICSQR